MLASLYSRRRWDAVPVEEFSFFLACFFYSRKRLESMFFCKCVLLWNEVDSNLISCFYRKFFTKLYATVLTPSKACFRAPNSLKFEICWDSVPAPTGTGLQHPPDLVAALMLAMLATFQAEPKCLVACLSYWHEVCISVCYRNRLGRVAEGCIRSSSLVDSPTSRLTSCGEVFLKAFLTCTWNEASGVTIVKSPLLFFQPYLSTRFLANDWLAWRT